MAILTALKVTDVADLRAEARAFESHAKDIQTTTNDMLELVSSTINVWKGAAQAKYSSQFASLSDDMNKIFEMCNEYSTDLIQIADNYEKAEEQNEIAAERLKADVELK